MKDSKYKTIQQIFDKFKQLSEVCVDGDKWEIHYIAGMFGSSSCIILEESKSTRQFMLCESDIENRWRLKDDKLHYIKKNLITGDITLISAEI